MQHLFVYRISRRFDGVTCWQVVSCHVLTGTAEVPLQCVICCHQDWHIRNLVAQRVFWTNLALSFRILLYSVWLLFCTTYRDELLCRTRCIIASTRSGSSAFVFIYRISESVSSSSTKGWTSWGQATFGVLIVLSTYFSYRPRTVSLVYWTCFRFTWVSAAVNAVLVAVCVETSLTAFVHQQLLNAVLYVYSTT